ncbi:hypothetical protein BSFP_038660 [Burkholderia stabilis]|uniref:Uncharacterized protein n=1 Tax=Burkholderia stabilis TaxID=95485 RepID=A0A1Y1BLU5_9BURK|nr:hypothetical protein BSFP_038660 [Burkholderia stabilis]
MGKTVFEWNGAPRGRRVVRHDGSGPQKVPRVPVATG